MMTLKRWLVAGGSVALTALGLVVNHVELAIAAAAAFGWSMPWLRDVRVIQAARMVLAAFGSRQHDHEATPALSDRQRVKAQAKALDELAQHVPPKNGPPQEVR